jgi:hypothetical protein
MCKGVGRPGGACERAAGTRGWGAGEGAKEKAEVEEGAGATAAAAAMERSTGRSGGRGIVLSSQQVGGGASPNTAARLVGPRTKRKGAVGAGRRGPSVCRTSGAKVTRRRIAVRAPPTRRAERGPEGVERRRFGAGASASVSGEGRFVVLRVGGGRDGDGEEGPVGGGVGASVGIVMAREDEGPAVGALGVDVVQAAGTRRAAYEASTSERHGAGGVVAGGPGRA